MDMHQDKIILKGMRFYGYHGYLAAERELGQWFEVDVELTVDISAAADSDDVEYTVNYAEVYAGIKAVAESESLALIEALAAKIVRACFAFVRVEHVKVLVKKPQAPLGGPLDYAAVEMERSRGEMA